MANEMDSMPPPQSIVVLLWVVLVVRTVIAKRVKSFLQPKLERLASPLMAEAKSFVVSVRYAFKDDEEKYRRLVGLMSEFLTNWSQTTNNRDIQRFVANDLVPNIQLLLADLPVLVVGFKKFLLDSVFIKDEEPLGRIEPAFKRRHLDNDQPQPGFSLTDDDKITSEESEERIAAPVGLFELERSKGHDRVQSKANEDPGRERRHKRRKRIDEVQCTQSKRISPPYIRLRDNDHDRVEREIKEDQGREMHGGRERTDEVQCAINKSISYLDFSGWPCCTPSYLLLPQDQYHVPHSSGRTELEASVLNGVCISMVSRSSSSFQSILSMLEQVLYDIEDRFKLEMLIELCKVTTEKAEQLLKIIQNEGMEPDQTRVTDHLNYSNLWLIERLYGDHGLDVVDRLCDEPSSTILHVIVSRLKQKLEEWTEYQSASNAAWARQSKL